MKISHKNLEETVNSEKYWFKQKFCNDKRQKYNTKKYFVLNSIFKIKYFILRCI